MDFGKKDRIGRTAMILLVLRNACGSYVDTNGLQAKFRMLYEKIPVREGVREGWMTPRRVLSVPVARVRSKLNREITEMTHND